MPKVKDQIRNTDRVFLAISVFALIGIGIVSSIKPAVFQPYFGNLSPTLATLAVGVAGAVAIYRLRASYRFEICNPDRTTEGIQAAAMLTLPFIAAVTLADVFLGFPSNINVTYPLSLLFYPAIGYVAQMALHIVPLALFLALVNVVFRSWSLERRVWGAIMLSATIEAIFQVDTTSVWLSVFVVIHLFLFGVAELFLFRRYDYLTMYVFRILYYSYWHILWGQMRLKVLY